ncbi:tRNA (guanine-N(7)-)-methyltransferase [Rhodococcus rhodnii LMG 5362]|uniref:tRNA (guanine-N(7)-)-methyltransferase n=1 Tax=Rhodococcus rhodnii LMG 5362 TaxID=1273125 RepID=R7WQW0_9NOCA|nr:tRNA (guanine-N(7)-)-methyltransferase [Rhodococcus rhodnii LMG 5362]
MSGADRPGSPSGNGQRGRDRDGRGSHLYPRVTSFRSRRGTLTDAQQGAWDRQWERLGSEVAPERHLDTDAPRHLDTDAPRHLDTDAWFGRSAPLVLEIGSGTGTATSAMAQAEPELDLLAVEVYRPGIAQLLQQIERAELGNIRILRGDAVVVLEEMLAPQSLTAVRVYFPDPWPKARHHKRRLLQSGTFALVADRLKPGGLLHIATDHAEYAEHISETGDAEPALRRLDWHDPGMKLPVSVQRPVTKFENKAHDVGREINDMIWIKPS